MSRRTYTWSPLARRAGEGLSYLSIYLSIYLYLSYENDSRGVAAFRPSDSPLSRPRCPRPHCPRPRCPRPRCPRPRWSAPCSARVDLCAVPVGARAPARPAPARPAVAALRATMSRATSLSSRATRRPVRFQGSTTRPMPCSARIPATRMFDRFATSTQTRCGRSCARAHHARSCSSATPTSS